MVENRKIAGQNHNNWVSGEDPLRRREQFAISLRRNKKQDIIAKKRQKLLPMLGLQQNQSDQSRIERIEESVQVMNNILTPQQAELDVVGRAQALFETFLFTFKNEIDQEKVKEMTANATRFLFMISDWYFSNDD